MSVPSWSGSLEFGLKRLGWFRIRVGVGVRARIKIWINATEYSHRLWSLHVPHCPCVSVFVWVGPRICNNVLFCHAVAGSRRRNARGTCMRIQRGIHTASITRWRHFVQPFLLTRAFPVWSQDGKTDLAKMKNTQRYSHYRPELMNI